LKLKRWILIPIIAGSLGAKGQEQASPTEEDCLSLIAVLPTFHSEKMKAYYDLNPNASGKELVEKIQSLADGSDKDVQFTYSMLLFNGYCVPKDICAARRYLEKSRGGPNNWEQMYPIPPWPKDAVSGCAK